MRVQLTITVTTTEYDLAETAALVAAALDAEPALSDITVRAAVEVD